MLNLSRDRAWQVMDRAVRRGTPRREAIPSRLLLRGADGKAFRGGLRYLAIVNGIERGNVGFIPENRD